jgi:hypothetical protein
LGGGYPPNAKKTNNDTAFFRFQAEKDNLFPVYLPPSIYMTTWNCKKNDPKIPLSTQKPNQLRRFSIPKKRRSCAFSRMNFSTWSLRRTKSAVVSRFHNPL